MLTPFTVGTVVRSCPRARWEHRAVTWDGRELRTYVDGEPTSTRGGLRGLLAASLFVRGRFDPFGGCLLPALVRSLLPCEPRGR